MPTSPLAPNGASYFDGCQWGTKNISVTGNSFSIDPTYINANKALNGQTTSCTAANACGTNFMAFQVGGEAPFDTPINANSMMSNSLTACPSWDSGCTTNPLKNLNALSNPPNAPAANGEPANNNIWSNNSYYGPWLWNAYYFGACNPLPSDPQTGHSMPASPSPCSNVDFTHWQSYWQQDAGSTFSPTPSSTPSNTISPSSTPTPIPTPTPTPSGKIGDLNHDGSVNIFDLSILLSGWGTTSATDDLNGDGTVNIFDLSIFLSHWGT
jgi:hypothetical protein